MSRLKTLLAKYAEKREEKKIDKWIESIGNSTIIDPEPQAGCFCGCILPLLFWGGIFGIIGFTIYKLFF